MIRIDFTDEQIEQLNYERYHHEHPRVRLRMETLWLKSQGLPHYEISRLADVAPNTMRTYFRQFLSGGVEALKELTFHQPESAFAPYQDEIVEELTKNPPKNSQQAAAILEKITGVKRGPQATRNYLKSIGFSVRKVGIVPAKADPEVQAEFVKKS